MTPEDRQRLQELIAKWRDRQAQAYPEYEGSAAGDCANELDALVRAGGVPQPETDGFSVGQVWKSRDKREQRSVRIVTIEPNRIGVRNVATDRLSYWHRNIFRAHWEQVEDQPTRAGGVEAPPAEQGSILDGDPRWQRLYNLVSTLAHPHGDCLENPPEDEAHDLIRELRGKVGQIRVQLAEARGAVETPAQEPRVPKRYRFFHCGEGRHGKCEYVSESGDLCACDCHPEQSAQPEDFYRHAIKAKSQYDGQYRGMAAEILHLRAVVEALRSAPSSPPPATEPQEK